MLATPRTVKAKRFNNELFRTDEFYFFRDLRCLRNTIHANLFITYILTDFLWIVNLSIEVRDIK